MALPSFPQLRRPDAPSKSLLALQGLDKALIEAELVEPDTVLPLDTSDKVQHEETGLDLKTRKRLHELGITELFAGAFLTYSLGQRLIRACNSADCGGSVPADLQKHEGAV